MSDNITDDQQFEELKKWWKENGRAIVLGIVLGLGAIGGWQGWQGWQLSQAEAGATLYDNFIAHMQTGNTAAAEESFTRIQDDFGRSIYAAFAHLYMASKAVQDNAVDLAISHLQQVTSNSKDKALVQLAALRLARLQLDRDDLIAARNALQLVQEDAFVAEVLALEGRIALAENDYDKARAAIIAARDLGAADSELLGYLLQQLDTQ